MSQSLRSNIDFIKQLAICSTAERRELLENASNKNIKALSELCLNLLRGNLPIDYKTKTKLKKTSKINSTPCKKTSSFKKQKGNHQSKRQCRLSFTVSIIGSSNVGKFDWSSCKQSV